MNQSQPEISELAEEVDSSPEDLEALLSEETEQEETEEGEEVEGEEPEANEKDPDEWKSKTYDVNGEKLSGAELASGYMKDADYRQKTERAAQLTRQADKVIEDAQQERAFLANRVGVLIQASEEEIVGNQQELARLAVENPAEWVKAQHLMSVKSQKLNALYQQRDAIQARNNEVSQAQYQQFVNREYETLLSKVPAWKDSTVEAKEMREIVEYGITQGYTAEELNSVADHRALLVLRKAMLNDKRGALKPTPTQGRTVHPNAAKPNSGARPNQGDLRKVMQGGSQDQRIGAIANLLG